MMKKQIWFKKSIGLLLTIALLLVNINTFAGTTTNGVDEYSSYFNDVYPHLTDTANVYKTLTYEGLVNLFDSDGTYVVLFGGAWNDNTQANIGFINDVAKEYGVSTIYNFDTRLDGSALEIADSNNQFSNYYVDLVNKYLTNIVTLYDKNDGNAEHNVSYTDKNSKVNIASKIQSPFLFVYNKNHKDAQNNPAPIVSYLEHINVWEDFLTNGSVDSAKVEAYKALVRPVFDAISTDKVAKVDTIDSLKYFATGYNTNGKATILDSSDANLVYEQVTYNQLTKLLNSKGNYAILFGGSWCTNTQAVIKFVNQYAKKYNVDKIYVWDTKLDAGIAVSDPSNNPHDNNTIQIRTTGHPYANLYVDLVNTYLTNITTIYDKNDGKATHNVSYADANGIDHIANKLQVPFLFLYNKDNKDTQGNSAPIIGSVEKMFTWTNIQPNYVSTDGTGVNYVTYTTELDNLFGLLSKPQTIETPAVFTDVANHWAKDYIIKLHDKGFIGGYPDGTFQPDNNITRQEVSVVLAKSIGQQAVENPQFTFSDANEIESWAAGYVKALGNASIIGGYTDGTFKPNDKITRAELSIIIVKALGEQPKATEATAFEDDASIPDWAKGYVAKAFELGIIGGSDNNGKTYFNPNDFATRAEVSAIISKILK